VRILYGTQGNGNGHLTRTLAIVPALRALGLDVDLIFSSQESDGIRKGIPELEPYRSFYGLPWVREAGRINWLKTLEITRPAQLAADFRSLTGKYDLVITDFEPFAAWWGISNGVPVIGIGNQYAFQGEVPRPRIKNPGGELFIKYFAPVDVPMGIYLTRATPTTVPPIVRPAVRAAAPEVGDHVLVYLPSFAIERLDDVFGKEELKGQPFVCYPRRSPYEPHAGNVVVKDFSTDGFLEDLRTARAVVTSGGFTLLSECLHLGKPIYVIPEANQYEQLCNAEAVKKWRLGATARDLNAARLAAWLAGPPRVVERRFPDVPPAFARWIADGQPGGAVALADALWREAAAETS
jgi:uncharacterized protein (TIGR00661 family)